MGEVYYFLDPSLFIPRTPAAIQKQTEISAEIRVRYLSGVPLFTKQQLHDIKEQFKALAGKPGSVFITTLSGDVVGFIVRTGEVLSQKNPNRERIMYVEVIFV
jgi:hypothetical protein